MACACVNAGKPRCAWCNEAVVNGFPIEKHNCQYGNCTK